METPSNITILTLDQVRLICPDAAEDASEFDLTFFYVRPLESYEEPGGLVHAGVAMLLFGCPTDDLEGEETFEWDSDDGSWRDTSRF